MLNGDWEVINGDEQALESKNVKGNREQLKCDDEPLKGQWRGDKG